MSIVWSVIKMNVVNPKPINHQHLCKLSVCLMFLPKCIQIVYYKRVERNKRIGTTTHKKTIRLYCVLLVVPCECLFHSSIQM